jgi:hypothetical protein
VNIIKNNCIIKTNLCSGIISKLCARIKHKGKPNLHSKSRRTKYRLDKTNIVKCNTKISGENILSLGEFKYTLPQRTKLEK